MSAELKIDPNAYVQSVMDFLEVSPWITKEDQPAVTTLITCAFELDKKISAAMVAQFNLTYRALLKRNPANRGAAEDGDDLDDILEEARGA